MFVTDVVVTIGWLASGAAVATLGGMAAVQRYIRKARNDHSRRPQLWNRFYGRDWGDNTANNYGFAPSSTDGPQCFQEQMYRELLKRWNAKRSVNGSTRLLEVSCGRGGGLQAFIVGAKEGIDVTGLDAAGTAIVFCRNRYGESGELRFIEGNALNLPFADASFDVVLNIEASNDYGDRPGFFREVERVLKPDGVFLYADSFRTTQVDTMRKQMRDAGFAGDFDDVTANVLEACRMDTPRRRQALQRHVPIAARLLLNRQLANYAALEGSRKYRAFADGRRTYLMTAAVKA